MQDVRALCHNYPSGGRSSSRCSNGGRWCIFISVMSRGAPELCKNDVLPSPHGWPTAWWEHGSLFSLYPSSPQKSQKDIYQSQRSWTGLLIAKARDRKTPGADAVACCHGGTDDLWWHKGTSLWSWRCRRRRANAVILNSHLVQHFCRWLMELKQQTEQCSASDALAVRGGSEDEV